MKYPMLFTYTLSFAVLLQLFVTRNNVQCAPSNADQERKLLDSKNYKDFVDKRGKIVNEFHEIIASVIEIIDGYGSTFTGKEDDIQNLLGDLKSKWNEIEKLSMQIEKLVVSESADEMEEQKEDIKTLNNQYADILFQAKARNCKSFEETFYKPESKCLPIEDPSGGPCPEKQILYDGDFNEGFCQCVVQLGLVFHKESESCYQLNTQGPCEPGEWIILNSKERNEQLAVCEIIPDAMCPSDGSHVFYKDSCWELGAKGPCSEDQVFVRNPDNWASYDCTLDTNNVSHSVGDKVSFVACPSGSKRGKNGQCGSIYRPG